MTWRSVGAKEKRNSGDRDGHGGEQRGVYASIHGAAGWRLDHAIYACARVRISQRIEVKA